MLVTSGSDGRARTVSPITISADESERLDPWLLRVGRRLGTGGRARGTRWAAGLRMPFCRTDRADDTAAQHQDSRSRYRRHDEVLRQLDHVTSILSGHASRAQYLVDGERGDVGQARHITEL